MNTTIVMLALLTLSVVAAAPTAEAVPVREHLLEGTHVGVHCMLHYNPHETIGVDLDCS